MKILFAVSNEKISESIIKKYESIYKEIITGKNVYYFNAIIKELQKDKSYDRIIISEDLEPFSNKNYETIDNFIFDKLDNISDEAVTHSGDDIPIILLCADRRTKGEAILNKLFGIGVYSALIGQDRSIQNLCELIKKPRSKKDAKNYYKIDISDIDYKSENENNVSEVEIQNILTHYKRLGKNEDKYIESFNSIANQYTDEQLKVIIKFLPIGVKAVLEAGSPKYQQLATFSGESTHLKNQSPYNSSQVNPKTKKPRSTDRAIIDNGIKIESIMGEDDKKPSKPVIIPNTVSTKNVKKIQKPTINNNMNNDIRKQGIENILNEIDEEEPIIESIEPDIEPAIEETNDEMFDFDDEMIQVSDPVVEPVKRGRGRPRKYPPTAKPISDGPKRGRGRPRKNPLPEVVEEQEDEMEELDLNQYQNDIEDDINGIDDIFDEDVMLPQVEENNKDLDDFDEIDSLDFGDDALLPGFDMEFEDDKNETIVEENENDDEDIFETSLPGFEDEPILDGIDMNEEFSDDYSDDYQENEPITNYQEYKQEPKTTEVMNYNVMSSNVSNLLTGDKKIVAFVGTSKNGTSFLVNNLADMFSNQGIKTAILDLTKNKNSYYIYTKNEENLRKKAIDSISNLANGMTQGISVNRNLDVFTALPGENRQIDNYGTVLETLVQNYKLVLLDCDFETNYLCLKESSEIYLVQTMDVLTIQPLTAYLRDLKAKNILDQNKLKIVINKCTRVKSVTEKTIIAGMAFYNDPSMSYMTELFNRETIRYAIVPLDMQVYSKYLEGLINCNITVNGYPKEFNSYLKKLASMVYPLIDSPQNRMGGSKYNKYESNNTFSNATNDILNKMKQNY